jgi:hypothetical protein
MQGLRASGLTALLLQVLAGCSGASAPATGESHPRGDAAAAARGTACDAQSVRSEDVSGILIAPITSAKQLAGDVQTCEYSTGSFPAIIISVQPGLGKRVVDSWLAGRMPLKATPLTGVGDAAAWQDSLLEVISQKHDLLCDVQVRGGSADIAVPATALPAALGALCNRIFAHG